MPMSLRLPAETETMIADFGARHGLSKTAVIVRSIQEFLATHAQPSSLQVYEQAMRGITAPLPGNPASDSAREEAEKRPRKLGHLEAGKPDLICSANVGCLTHLQSGTATPVRHWVEVIDEVLG